MEIPDGKCDLGCVELNYIFWESLSSLELFVKFTSPNERNHEIESQLRLEKVVHTHKKGMVTWKENVFLQLSVVNLVEF